MSGGYLLDSHVLLWLSPSEPTLPSRVLEVLSDTTRPLYASVVSVVELSIKHATGKLDLPFGPEENAAEAFDELFHELGVEALPLTTAHAARMRDLPRHHGDPFDRLMICQAMEEGLTLVTHDRTFARYDGLAVLWA